jgi:hypothetical protein
MGAAAGTASRHPVKLSLSVRDASWVYRRDLTVPAANAWHRVRQSGSGLAAMVLGRFPARDWSDLHR